MKPVKEEKSVINETTIKMFNTFMIRNTTTAILNRNVKDNFILKLMGESPVSEEIETEKTNAIEEQTTNRLTQLLDKIKGKKAEEET